jgi:hypothetical protein
LSFAGKWRELETVMLSEISQSHKSIFSLICGIRVKKKLKTYMKVTRELLVI